MHRAISFAQGAAIGMGAVAILATVVWAFRPPAGPPAPLSPPPITAHAPPRHRTASLQPDDEPVAEDPAAEVRRPDAVPDQLGRKELEAAMAKLRPRVDRCREKQPFTGLLAVKLTIAKTGTVESVEVLPPYEQAPVASCVAKVVRAGSFPKFRGTVLPTVEWTYPFLWN